MEETTKRVMSLRGATRRSNLKAYREIASPKQSKEAEFTMTILP
jgi:hypothetical protein